MIPVLPAVLPAARYPLLAPEEAEDLDVRFRGLETALALKRFEAAKGRLPEPLEELVPEYLSRVPLDPFGGEPFRYSREGKILYSIGQDWKDGGGSGEEDPMKAQEDMDEPTFRFGR